MNKAEIKNVEKHRQELIKENNTLKNLLEIERNQAKRLAEAINYTHSSTLLKDRNKITFEQYMSRLGCHKLDGNIYVFTKDGSLINDFDIKICEELYENL